MATNAAEVTSLIDKMVQEKTLSLEAMDGIQALKKKAEAADQQIDRLTTNLNERTAERDDFAKQLAAVRDENKILTARDQGIAAREAAVFKNELRAAVAEATATAFEKSMRIVFAPNIVRESVLKNNGGTTTDGRYVNSTESGIVSRSEGYADEKRDGSSPSSAPGVGSAL